MENQPICLTITRKKVLNRDTYYLPHFMSLNKIGSGLAAAIALAATSVNAQEADQSAPKAVEATAPETVERDAGSHITREQCRALATKVEKITCFKNLQAQNAAEIAARTEVREAETARADQAESSADAEAARNGERRTTNVVLSERIEGLEKLRDITREEIERNPSSN